MCRLISSGKKLGIGYTCLFALHWTLEVLTHKFKMVSFFLYCLRELTNAEPCLLPEQGDLGGDYISWRAMCGPNPSVLRKLGFCNSFPIVLCYAQVGICGVYLWCTCLSFSYSFWCGYFFSCLVWRSLSTSFWISLRKNWPMFKCLFDTSMEERKIRSFLFFIFLKLSQSNEIWLLTEMWT